VECCNAGVLLQDIENYLNGEALLSRSLSRTYRIRKRIGKYRKRIVAAIGFVGLLMIISVISFVSIRLEQKKSCELEQRLASLSEPQQQTNVGENNGYSWADAFVCLQDALT